MVIIFGIYIFCIIKMKVYIDLNMMLFYRGLLIDLFIGCSSMLYGFFLKIFV